MAIWEIDFAPSETQAFDAALGACALAAATPDEFLRWVALVASGLQSRGEIALANEWSWYVAEQLADR